MKGSLMSRQAFCLAATFLALAGTPCSAEIYMSAGKTVYRFNDAGQMIGSAAVDPSNVAAQGLARGPDGRIYVVINSGIHRVDSFSLDLSSHVTGFVSNGQAGLFIPIGIAIGSDDNLYVADNNPNRIDRFFGPNAVTPGGNAPLGANPGARWATVTSPVDVEFAPDGTLYASAATGINGTIFRFDSLTGTPTAVATDLQSGVSVDGIAINSDGTALFVRDSGQLLKYTINPDHSLTKNAGYSISYAAGGAGGLGPYPGIAFGPDGFLYASTRTNNGSVDPNFNCDYILRIDPDTGVTTAYTQGNINTFTNSQNPTYLIWVPEPSTLLLSVTAVVAMAYLIVKGRLLRFGSHSGSR